MKAGTLLEVMAEVATTVRRLDGCNDGTSARVVTLNAYAEQAFKTRGADRRDALRLAAALAILALHAHDAEAAQLPAYNPGPEGA